MLYWLWESEAYVLKGARTSPNGEVHESKHVVTWFTTHAPGDKPYGRKLPPLVRYTSFYTTRYFYTPRSSSCAFTRDLSRSTSHWPTLVSS